MTERERYLAVCTFKTPDKIPLHIGGGRKSTRERWEQEGLPARADPLRHICGELGIELPAPVERPRYFVETRMIPMFEEKVLKHENGCYVVQDWMGAITEISDKYDYTYIRHAIDFVTRKWHRFPVQTRAEWLDMKKRYDPFDPARVPENLPALGEKIKNRDYVITVDVNGPFWQLREWMGMENLCMAFLDEPDFVAEMIDFWCDFILTVLGRILPHAPFDVLHIHEDMAYKAHSMISPAMTRQFLQPVYDKWIAAVRAAGVPLVNMDSDGYVAELIPIWIESGIQICNPMEVAAHNDIVAFRREFGDKMAFTGGIDKRAMAAGGRTLADELRRVEPVVKNGGYIPGCDHGIPPDVSFENYRKTVRGVAKMTGWL